MLGGNDPASTGRGWPGPWRGGHQGSVASDKDVGIAERRAQGWQPYTFLVRTQEITTRRGREARRVTEKDGTALAFDYQLETFGRKGALPAPGVTDAKQGEWLPSRFCPSSIRRNCPLPFRSAM